MPLQLPAGGPVAREQRFQISIRPLHAALPRGFEASCIKENSLHFTGPIDAVRAQRHVWSVSTPFPSFVFHPEARVALNLKRLIAER